MNRNETGNRAQLIYKYTAYLVIIGGGIVSGALAGSVIGTIRIVLSVEDVSILGAVIGATIALVGCRFARDHDEAVARDQDVFKALEHRLSPAIRGAEPSVSTSSPEPFRP